MTHLQICIKVRDNKKKQFTFLQGRQFFFFKEINEKYSDGTISLSNDMLGTFLFKLKTIRGKS